MRLGAQLHNGHPNIGSQRGAPEQIQEQLDIGPDGLNEQDRFLLECKFDKLATTAGEHQEHWLLAIQAAREASHIRAQQVEATQSCSHSRKWKQAHT